MTSKVTIATTTSTELGWQAAASSNWRWRSGTKFINPQNRSTGRYEEGEVPLRSMYGCVPDLNDDATRGCLLMLCREAWGDPGLAVIGYFRGGVFGWKAVGNCDDDTFYPTEAAALVATLKNG